MERVTGIGGIFFKSKDPKGLRDWYRDRLGIPTEDWGGAAFSWRDENQPERKGATIWSPFSDTTEYFNPSKASFMINYRVENLDAMIAQLRREGATVDDKVEESEFGRFGWAMDPEGNRFEIWEPPKPPKE